jgi:hypothetical protein
MVGRLLDRSFVRLPRRTCAGVGLGFHVGHSRVALCGGRRPLSQVVIKGLLVSSQEMFDPLAKLSIACAGFIEISSADCAAGAFERGKYDGAHVNVFSRNDPPPRRSRSWRRKTTAGSALRTFAQLRRELKLPEKRDHGDPAGSG